jgi:rsbT co-antagonist protein RsbR
VWGFRDVTERKRAEQERVRLQEEIIRTQTAALAELSTPLIPVSDRVMVMPLIGTVDARRAQDVLDTLLHGIAESKAEVAILDITGVPLVDAQVANGLVRAAHAVQLLGAQVVLTGIRPEVAQTLVGLGVDLSGIITRSTVQSGIAYALERSSS